DHRCDLFQHTKTIVAEHRELHRIGTRRSVVLGPLHINLAFRFIQQVGHVGTIDGMDGNALATSDVADDGLAPNRVATAGAIHQQVAVALDANGVVVLVATEDAPHHARESARLLLFLIGQRRADRRRHASQYLTRRIFAVANARHEVIGTPRAVVGRNFLQLLVLNVLERYAILARFFLDELTANLNRALPLMDIEPMFDLVAGARRLGNRQPVAARLVPSLGQDFYDVPAVQLEA